MLSSIFIFVEVTFPFKWCFCWIPLPIIVSKIEFRAMRDSDTKSHQHKSQHHQQEMFLLYSTPEWCKRGKAALSESTTQNLNRTHLPSSIIPPKKNPSIAFFFLSRILSIFRSSNLIISWHWYWAWSLHSLFCEPFISEILQFATSPRQLQLRPREKA